MAACVGIQAAARLLNLCPAERQGIITFEPLIPHEEELLQAFRLIHERDAEAALELITLVEYAGSLFETDEEQGSLSFDRFFY